MTSASRSACPDRPAASQPLFAPAANPGRDPRDRRHDNCLVVIWLVANLVGWRPAVDLRSGQRLDSDADPRARARRQPAPGRWAATRLTRTRSRRPPSRSRRGPTRSTLRPTRPPATAARHRPPRPERSRGGSSPSSARPKRDRSQASARPCARARAPVHAPARPAADRRRRPRLDRRHRAGGDRDRDRDRDQRLVRLRPGAAGRARCRGARRLPAKPRTRRSRDGARAADSDLATSFPATCSSSRRASRSRPTPASSPERSRSICRPSPASRMPVERSSAFDRHRGPAASRPAIWSFRDDVHRGRGAGGRLRDRHAHRARPDREPLRARRARGVAARGPGAQGRLADRPDRRAVAGARLRADRDARAGLSLGDAVVFAVGPPGRPRARRTAAGDHPGARRRGARARPPRRGGQAPERGRDARLDERHLHRQDRDADREPDARRRGLDAGIDARARHRRSTPRRRRARPARRSPRSPTRCNNARLDGKTASPDPGDPTEVALLDACAGASASTSTPGERERDRRRTSASIPRSS